jgi:hypothetical protein
MMTRALRAILHRVAEKNDKSLRDDAAQWLGDCARFLDLDWYGHVLAAWRDEVDYKPKYFWIAWRAALNKAPQQALMAAQAGGRALQGRLGLHRGVRLHARALLAPACRQLLLQWMPPVPAGAGEIASRRAGAAGVLSALTVRALGRTTPGVTARHRPEAPALAPQRRRRDAEDLPAASPRLRLPRPGRLPDVRLARRRRGNAGRPAPGSGCRPA